MPQGPDKIYTAIFTRVVDRMGLIRGLQDAGFDLRLEQMLIRFQNGHVGKAAVNALQGFPLSGKKIWAGGAKPKHQVDAYDPRGPTPIDQKPEAADIQRCVTEASVKPVRKGEEKATKSPIAQEAGISNNDDNEDSEEDSVEEQDDDMAENQNEELEKDQEQDMAENQGRDQDEEPSDSLDSSSEEESSDSDISVHP